MDGDSWCREELLLIGSVSLFTSRFEEPDSYEKLRNLKPDLVPAHTLGGAL
jgi:hypothetical protein